MILKFKTNPLNDDPIDSTRLFKCVADYCKMRDINWIYECEVNIIDKTYISLEQDGFVTYHSSENILDEI